MKSGLIVYSDIDAVANHWFIRAFLQAFNDQHFCLSYVREKDVLDYVSREHVDFVIYRSRQYEIVEQLEAQKMRVFNNSLVNKIANNKYLAFKLFKELDFPTIETYLDGDSLKMPYIMKTVSGHGGKEVFLIDEEEKEKVLLEQFKGQDFIYQSPVANYGDVRLYVFNKKVIASIKRSNVYDFRSNHSLGGDIELYQPTKEMVDIAIKIAKHLDADYIGVDFLLIKDGFLLNEIEDPVGARMLYQLTDIDIVKEYTNYIKNIMR